MKSTEFLQSAMDVQKERGEQYDKPSGERSMGATVRAFNAITGHVLEESDGWMLLGLLKLVRQSQNPEKYHHDSALDFVAYASLYAEAASEQCGQVEDDLFKGAPEWAQYLVHDSFGACWFEKEPVFDSVHDRFNAAEFKGGAMKTINGESVSPARIIKRPQ